MADSHPWPGQIPVEFALAMDSRVEEVASQPFNNALSFMVRMAYCSAYWTARCWWFVRRPRTHGALAALWHEGRILIVRTSYRRLYTLPGGFLRRGEHARHAAARELFEELRIRLPPDALTSAWYGSIPFEHRDDTVTVFEATLDVPPLVQVDGRELVWTSWATSGEAMRLPLLPHVREYLVNRDRLTPRRGCER